MDGHKPDNNVRLILKNVILTYPALYAADQYLNNAPTFKAVFLIDRLEHRKLAAEAEEISERIIKAHSRKGVAESCVSDGDGSTYPGYPGRTVVQTSSPENRPPQLRKRDASMSIMGDNLFYSGCRVLGVIDLYWHPVHTRVCGSLLAVQFLDHGPQLVGEPIDDDIFVNMEGEEDEKTESGSADTGGLF